MDITYDREYNSVLWALAREKYRINMNRTSSVKGISRNTRHEQAAKSGPLALLNEFDRQYCFNRTSFRGLALGDLRKRSFRAAQVQETCDLLLRSLVLRIVQNCGNAG